MISVTINTYRAWIRYRLAFPSAIVPFSTIHPLCKTLRFTGLSTPTLGWFFCWRPGFFMAYCIALQHYLRRQCISRPSPMHRCIKLVGLLDWTFSLAFVVLDGLALAPLVRILMFTFLAERAVGVQLVGCVHLSQFASAGSFILSSSLCPFAWHIL